MKYLIVIEKSATGHSAYSPDLPGCISTAVPIAAERSSTHLRAVLRVQRERCGSEQEGGGDPHCLGSG